MKKVLFCVPIKDGCVEQYKAFARETVERSEEYHAMLQRYDMHCARIWHKQFNGKDYVLVYHEVGPEFEERMKSWDTSEHPFDKWFRESMMAVYDIDDASGMEQPEMVIDFPDEVEE